MHPPHLPKNTAHATDPESAPRTQIRTNTEFCNLVSWLQDPRPVFNATTLSPLTVPDLWQSLEATLQPRKSVEPNQHVGLRSYEFCAGRVVRSPEMGGYIKEGLASWSNALKSRVLGAYIQEGCFCKQFLFMDRTCLRNLVGSRKNLTGRKGWDKSTCYSLKSGTLCPWGARSGSCWRTTFIVKHYDYDRQDSSSLGATFR